MNTWFIQKIQLQIQGPFKDFSQYNTILQGPAGYEI